MAELIFVSLFLIMALLFTVHLMVESFASKEPQPDIYRPLDKDTQEIRLFEIIPSENPKATVELRLFHCRLEDVSGEFIPFSYVWGDPKDTEPIKVNGISTKVTSNLSHFLRQTRTLLPDILAKGSWALDKPAIFWADAICINQQDREERNHQIQLLKCIYSSAPMVLAWLGHVHNAHLAVSLAESLGQPHGPEFALILPTLDYSSWMHRHPHLWTVSEGRNAYWEVFKALFQSAYWTRTWTFQEMVLPTDILFVCGSSVMKWQSIIAVQELLIALVSMITCSKLPATEAHQDLFSALGSALGQAFIAITASISKISKTRQNLSSGLNCLDLTLVPRLANHQVTDPRDRVYGLLGVIETRLEADYTKDTAQVYRDFASTWVDEVENLNFLLHSKEDYRIARHSSESLPSWAPDWEAVSQKQGDTRNYSDLMFFMDQFNPHDASRQLRASNAHVCDNLSTLSAPGVVAGKVEEVYPYWRSDISDTDFAFGVLRLAIECACRFPLQPGLRGSPSDPGRHPFQSLLRLINTHEWSYQDRSDPRKSEELCLLVGLLAWVADSECSDWPTIAMIYLPLLGIDPGQDFSRAWKEETFEGYSAENNMLDREDVVAAMEWTWENFRGGVENMRKCARKHLGWPLKFVTNNGFLGTATAAQVGDLVVVLVGCKAPVLLRRKGSHYEHVGPCFVVGLMAGEAKEMVDQGETKMETFEIR